jgi:hypothetical protein
MVGRMARWPQKADFETLLILPRYNYMSRAQVSRISSQITMPIPVNVIGNHDDENGLLAYHFMK